MMNNTSKFICNIKEIPTVAKAVEDLRTFQTKRVEEAKFLKKRTKELRNEEQRRWNDIFRAAQEAGKIAAVADAEKFNMHLVGDDGDEQFVITPQGEGDGDDDHPIKKILSQLF